MSKILTAIALSIALPAMVHAQVDPSAFGSTVPQASVAGTVGGADGFGLPLAVAAPVGATAKAKATAATTPADTNFLMTLPLC